MLLIMFPDTTTYGEDNVSDIAAMFTPSMFVLPRSFISPVKIVIQADLICLVPNGGHAHWEI